ncbi:MAG: BACON domain-containing protein [Sphingobacteriaceae bacterium]|nr:BACON domain-containing protein [Sphingobacteriaceae bacterium]
MGTWTVTTPNSWLTLSTSTGSGSATFSVTAATNTASSSRNGFVIVKVGSYTDSIL